MGEHAENMNSFSIFYPITKKTFHTTKIAFDLPYFIARIELFIVAGFAIDFFFLFADCHILKWIASIAWTMEPNEAILAISDRIVLLQYELKQAEQAECKGCLAFFPFLFFFFSWIPRTLSFLWTYLQATRCCVPEFSYSEKSLDNRFHYQLMHLWGVFL